eukprot:5470966-Pyramimonas_sp.AAC.1
MPSRPCSLWPPCTQRTAAAREASEDRRVPEGEGSEDDCCDLLRKAGAPLTCLTGLSFPCRSTMTPSPCRWPMAQLPLRGQPKKNPHPSEDQSTHMCVSIYITIEISI